MLADKVSTRDCYTRKSIPAITWGQGCNFSEKGLK